MVNKITSIKKKTEISKKAQIKIQQTAFMLIALTLLFFLAGLFILAIKLSDLKKSATLLEEENAMLLAIKLANTPEFSCEQAYGSKRTHCVDFDKLLFLRQNADIYKDFWGVSNIEVRKIYPKTEEAGGENEGQGISCTNANYPDCDYIRILSSRVIGTDYSTFVALCRKESFNGGDIYDKCELAKLMVSYEAK